MAATRNAGAGATPPADEDARLLEWTIQLPDDASLKTLGKNLADAQQLIEWERNPSAPSLRTRDPWGSQIHVIRDAHAATTAR